jgi:DNA-binding Lrp family transcriptional regulator
LGFSKQKVWRIVHDLEQNGAIFAHCAVLNPKKMGKRSFIIMFDRSIKGADSNLTEQMTIHPIIKEMEEEGIHAVVEESFYLNGVYDWAILITVDEHKDLIRFLGLWRTYYGEYFSRVIQSEVMFVATRNSVINPKIEEIAEILR